MNYRITSSKTSRKMFATVFAAVNLIALPAIVFAATPHHIHIALNNASEAVRWYEEHMACEAVAERSDAVLCGTTEIAFVEGSTLGGSQGTGVDHIGFSVEDLTAKMTELENDQHSANNRCEGCGHERWKPAPRPQQRRRRQQPEQGRGTRGDNDQ